MMKRVLHFFFELVFARWMMPSAAAASTRHFLISGYTGLGHFVLKTAFIKKLEELYPGCKITIVAGNTFGTEFVLKGYPTFILNEKANALTKGLFFLQLRKEKFDVAFLPFDASPKFLIRGTIIAGVPIRVGHVYGDAHIPQYYYTNHVPVRKRNGRSEIDMNLDLLESLHQRSFKREYVPIVNWTPREGDLERFSLKKGRYICIQMGAANGHPTTKRWLEPHFRTLITRILEQHRDIDIVALGDKGDLPIVQRICESIESPRLKNLCGKIDMEDTKTLIGACRVLICHDSGLLHLGNALGTHVLALYGPSNPDYYALQLPTCHILRKPCECTPLLGLFPGMDGEPTEEEAAKKCPIPKCMERLTPDEVYSACALFL
jgi:ADP-heptose:LPS heptosyltransferase